MTRAPGSLRWAAPAALVTACLIPLLWPGDIPFINDEPILISRAVTANHEGRLVQAGLLGTWGFTYGPAPTWIYQALVAITHDLVLVAVLHAALMAGLAGVAFWWLKRSLGLWAWFAPVPLLSPYFWFYARVLWDNPFLLPLGAIAIAGYAAHLSSGSAAGFRVALAGLIVMPLVHLMSLALVVPLAAHLLVVRGRSLWTYRFSVVSIMTVAGVLAWPYWMALAASRSPGSTNSRSQGWLFPFSGGRLLSARGIDYFYGPGPVQGAVPAMAATVSWLAYGLVLGGMVVATWLVVRAAQTRHWTPRAHIALILLGSISCQAIISGVTGRIDHPHYHNGTWITFALLAWLAADALVTRTGRWRWTGIAVTGLLAASLLTSVAVVAIRLHRTGGTREVYGPTMANQQRIARSLARYSRRSPVHVDVSHYRRFPHTLETLRELNAQAGEGPERPLEIRYASDDPASGVIELAR